MSAYTQFLENLGQRLEDLPSPGTLVFRFDKDANGTLEITRVNPANVLRLPEEIVVTDSEGNEHVGKLRR